MRPIELEDLRDVRYFLRTRKIKDSEKIGDVAAMIALMKRQTVQLKVESLVDPGKADPFRLSCEKAIEQWFDGSYLADFDLDRLFIAIYTAAVFDDGRYAKYRELTSTDNLICCCLILHPYRLVWKRWEV